jgi:5-methylcytosine-specific restriction endonuclease McrA
MDETKLNWIKSLIAKNDMHEFYGSAEWQALAARTREAQHNECQRCKEKGFYSPCEAVHHVMHVKKHPELALSMENLECLCRACHEEAHANKNYINVERW